MPSKITFPCCKSSSSVILKMTQTEAFNRICRSLFSLHFIRLSFQKIPHYFSSSSLTRKSHSAQTKIVKGQTGCKSFSFVEGFPWRVFEVPTWQLIYGSSSLCNGTGPIDIFIFLQCSINLSVRKCAVLWFNWAEFVGNAPWCYDPGKVSNLPSESLTSFCRPTKSIVDFCKYYEWEYKSLMLVHVEHIFIYNFLGVIALFSNWFSSDINWCLQYGHILLVCAPSRTQVLIVYQLLPNMNFEKLFYPF